MDYMQIVEEGKIEELKIIYDIVVNQLPCRYITPPSIGKVSISFSEAEEKTVSRVGDAMATYCEVEVDGNIGYGCVPGNSPERARYAAVIDSIIWHEHPFASVISPMLDEIEQELACKWNGQLEELCV